MTSENEIMEILSNNLRVLLSNKGWKQTDLARALWPDAMKSGASLATSKRNTISRWVKGTRTPSASECLNIAEVFELTVEKLVTEKIKPRKTKQKKQLLKN